MKSIFIVCQHGGEKTPLKVIKDNFNGKVEYILANNEAFKKNERFIDTDLNRSFPGDEFGSREEKIAYKLVNSLKKYDYVFDLHTTTSDSPIFIITTSLSRSHLQLINSLNIPRVVYMKSSLAKGNSLIDHVKLGVSIEAGKESSKQTYEDYKLFLEDFLENKINVNKEFYEVFGTLSKEKGEKLASSVRSFNLVKKGELISYKDNKERKAEFDFYPIMPGERSYKDVLTMTARGIDIAELNK